MMRTRPIRTRETFVIQGDAPTWAHDLARQIERALAGYLRDPDFGPFTYKSDIVLRMTPSQRSDFDTLLDQTTPTMRLLWGAIQAVYHRSDLFPEFYGMFVEEYGMAEADRILAVSGNA